MVLLTKLQILFELTKLSILFFITALLLLQNAVVHLVVVFSWYPLQSVVVPQSFMTLTCLKRSGQLFCGIFLSLSLLDVYIEVRHLEKDITEVILCSS